ncbi:MAG: hypothetical protein FJ390_03245 [Verrucomicrobia bacterium]|nr:hypothetical protein [Verrucomicrobiota bacterium]
MITVATISFDEFAQKKARARILDQQLVERGYAKAVQKKNSLLHKMNGSLIIKPKPTTFRTRLCLTPHHK